MRTRSREDSQAGGRLPFPWDDKKPEANPNNPDFQHLKQTPTLQPDTNTPATPQPADKTAAAPAQPSPEHDTQQAAAIPPQPAEDNAPQQRHKQTSIDLSPIPEKVGTALIAHRKKAGVSLDDLEQCLHIPKTFMLNLENGNYAEFKRQSIDPVYIKLDLSNICRELGISKAATEELQELLMKEMQEAGMVIDEDEPQNSLNDHSISPVHIQPDNGGKTPVMTKITAVIVVAIVLLFVVVLILALVVPLIEKSRARTPGGDIDVAPLIKPTQPQAMRIPIP